MPILRIEMPTREVRMTKTPTHKWKCRENYPVPGYGGYTTDERHCPRCGSEDVTILLGSFSSGSRIGVCHECGENYIVKRREAE